MGKIDWEKVKSFLKDKRTIKTAIIILTAAIFILIIWLFVSIYTKDKPKTIPEETRGAIREGIKEQIGEPIKSLNQAMGDAIIDAAYTENTTINQTPSNNTNTDTWQTYKNPEYGYEVKYPEGWVAYSQGATAVSFTDSSNKKKLDEYAIQYRDTDFPYWGGMLLDINRIDNFTQSLDDYIKSAFYDKGKALSSITDNNFSVIYYEDKGPNRFGGGTGYYYFIKPTNTNVLFEIGVDFYMDQPIDSNLLNLMRNVYNNFTFEGKKVPVL